MRKQLLIFVGVVWSIAAFCNEGDPVGNQITKLFVVSATGETKWGLIHYPSTFFSSSVKYPLLVFNHGAGEAGGTEATLPRLNVWGPGWFIANTSWNLTVTSPRNGMPYEFLYFAMQDDVNNSPTASEVMYVINNDPVIRDRIDPNAIFITGISVGGGSTINFTLDSRETASRIAAIVPMSAAAEALNFGNILFAQQSRVPVWAFHGLNDKVADYHLTTLPFVNYMNEVSPTLAKWTQLPATHSGWNNYYTPSYRETIDGLSMNIYEWMLYHVKNQESILEAVLGLFTARVVDGSTVLDWQTLTETNNQKFIIERSEDGKNFDAVGEIPSKGLNGNSGVPLNYEFIYQYK